MSSPTVTYGRSADVLADRFFERSAPEMPEEIAAAWFQRTDYGWVCSADSCRDVAGCLYKTLAGAKMSADRHAGEHPGATVKQI